MGAAAVKQLHIHSVKVSFKQVVTDTVSPQGLPQQCNLTLRYSLPSRLPVGNMLKCYMFANAKVTSGAPGFTINVLSESGTVQWLLLLNNSVY